MIILFYDVYQHRVQFLLKHLRVHLVEFSDVLLETSISYAHPMFVDIYWALLL